MVGRAVSKLTVYLSRELESTVTVQLRIIVTVSQAAIISSSRTRAGELRTGRGLSDSFWNVRWVCRSIERTLTYLHAALQIPIWVNVGQTGYHRRRLRVKSGPVFHVHLVKKHHHKARMAFTSLIITTRIYTTGTGLPFINTSAPLQPSMGVTVSNWHGW